MANIFLANRKVKERWQNNKLSKQNLNRKTLIGKVMDTKKNNKKLQKL